MLHLVLSVALGLHLSPCTVTKAAIPARCGSFGVYENRESRTGRVIALRVLVVPAKHPSGRALTWIDGGPGAAAVAAAPVILSGVYVKEFLAVHDTYDEIFMDARGTGESHPFGCNFTPSNDPAAYFSHLWPPKLLDECVKATRAYADPNQYNTNNAVDDLDDLRASLGYNQWVLDGGSYGTFAAFVYIRRHGPHVAAAILNAVDAPHFQAIPGAPEGAQTAFNAVVAKCERDSACHRNFPNVAQQFQLLLARLAHPIPMTVTGTSTHKSYQVQLSKEVFVDQFRHLLYDPEGVSFVPLILDRTAHGDYTPLGRILQLVAEGFSTTVNSGAYLSYSCADQIPFITDAQIEKAAAGSFAGDLRVRAQQRACMRWNVRPMPPSFNEPVRTNVQIVMLSGSDDPASPPELATAARAYLPNAKQIVVRGAAHGAETPCTDKLVEQFLAKLSTRGLDTRACSVSERVLPFATSVKELP